MSLYHTGWPWRWSAVQTPKKILLIKLNATSPECNASVLWCLKVQHRIVSVSRRRLWPIAATPQRASKHWGGSPGITTCSHVSILRETKPWHCCWSLITTDVLRWVSPATLRWIHGTPFTKESFLYMSAKVYWPCSCPIQIENSRDI